jgi:repressor LexA
MSNKFSNIKERVLYVVEKKGYTREDFFKKINMTYGNFTGKAKETPLNSNAISNILLEIPDLNPEWLLTGNGETLKEQEKKNTAMKLEANIDGQKKGIPLVPFDAFAGLGDSNVAGVDLNTIEERYDVPLFYNIRVDFMISVRGSSMYPKYSSGDVVACRLIDELLFVQWNKIYVIDSISQGIIMKRLKKSNIEGSVVCKSDNSEYGEFEVPMRDIRKIALVVGSIRLE